MTEEEWSDIFQRALNKTVYTKDDYEDEEVYAAVVQQLKNKHLKYVTYRDNDFVEEFVTAAKNELIDRAILGETGD